MIEITKSIEQSLWLRYYEKYLCDSNGNNGNGYSAHGAAKKADEVLEEFQSRNKYVDDFED